MEKTFRDNLTAYVGFDDASSAALKEAHSSIAEESTMPSARSADLPPLVRHVLPAHAQDIFRAALDNAYDRYGGDGEGRAHRSAWAAVKRRHEKLGDVWVERPRLG